MSLHPKIVCVLIQITLLFYSLPYPLVPASAPQNLSASSITSTGVKFSWSPLSTSQQNGIIIGYSLMLFELFSMHQWNLTSNDTTLSILAILSPHTSYKFAVAAKTVIGLGPFSSDIFFKTKEDCMLCSCMYY